MSDFPENDRRIADAQARIQRLHAQAERLGEERRASTDSYERAYLLRAVGDCYSDIASCQRQIEALDY